MSGETIIPKERADIHLARYKKGGQKFELVIRNFFDFTANNINITFSIDCNRII